MSERILRALMQMFAIIAKVDGADNSERQIVESFLKQQLNLDQVEIYLKIFDEYLESHHNISKRKEGAAKRTSVNSVKVLRICNQINQELEQAQKIKEHLISTQVILVANKIDIETLNDLKNEFIDFPEMIFISAKKQLNINELKNKLLSLFDARTVSATDTIVTNARHASSLTNANLALKKVLEGLNNNIVPDLLALDIRYALNEIGLITGEVSNEDLLNNIFSKF